ncbi:MXRA5 [Branchiostoma lanceolatum]|uniref:MXRA5 protein n=1 Tax=Branchiostoma lanceolatum TaxID=7740 RepID=A0A8K0AA72_BRALA|nr:MXRA5 [Branchiostoma lanceolatum]
MKGGTLPCAKCNTAGQADENQLECLPGTLKKLQVAGHSDRNGRLKTLPRLGELRMLILGPGSIHTAAEGAFESVSSILALSMSKNAIKAVGSWFGGLAKLEKLFLSWNEIIEIKENAFQPLLRLRYLELRHNRLRAVEEWHFASLTNLEHLHLSYNNISHVAGRSFNRLSRLNTLNLDHNQLSSLSTEWFLGLSATMTFLNLQNNLISTIPATLPANTAGRRVYLQNNPFRCTCALGSFESLDRRVYDRQRLQCSYPPSLSGRKIADVPKADMPCPSPTTTTTTRRNARMTERIVKATGNNTHKDGTTPAADKAQRQTAMTAVSTSKPTRQNGRMTEMIVKTTDKNSPKDSTTPAAKTALWQTVTLIFMGIISAIVALLVLERAVAKCYKKLRPQRHDVQGNAAGAIGGIPLQNIQPPAAAPTAGNPLPPHLTNNEIPDDTPITPYAETSRLENPVYGADVTGPRGATSIPDHRPRSNRPPNSSASSRPHGSGTTRAGNVPNPPPRPNRPADSSDSNYYPPSTQTTQAAKIPDPLPRTNRYVNSNVSSQPQDLEMPQARRIPDPLPRTHTYVNSDVSSQQRGRKMATMPRRRPSSVPQGLGMDEEEDVEGPNIYFDLNGPPRPSSSKMRPAEDVPDPLPRTNRYVNSSVSSQQRGSKMATMPRRRPTSNPRHKEEEVEGPNIYLDLNGRGRPVTFWAP